MADQPVKKTFFRISKKKKAALKAKKRALEVEVDPSRKWDVAFLRCPECNQYFENPVLLRCGHLVCKLPCAEKLSYDYVIECPGCHERTDLDREKGIHCLETISLFSSVLAKIKSGIDPGIMPEFVSLSEKFDKDPASEFSSHNAPPRLLPSPLNCLKEIILDHQQNQGFSIKTRRPMTKKAKRKMIFDMKSNERFKHLMRERAAKLIALPREDRESLIKFWTEKQVRFPPLPPPSVMDQLHERCKAQAKAFEIQENDTHQRMESIPSLFDINVSRPGIVGPPDTRRPPPGNDRIFRPERRSSVESNGWNIENEETREEEQWVNDEHFRFLGTEMEDFYGVSSERHFYPPVELPANGPHFGPSGPRPGPHQQPFPRHPRPPFDPNKFHRVPHRGEPPRLPPLMRPPPCRPMRMPFDPRVPLGPGPRPPRPPFGPPPPYPNGHYNSRQRFGQQQYHHREHYPVENDVSAQQELPFQSSQYQHYHDSGVHTRNELPQPQPRLPPPNCNPEMFPGQEIDSYITRPPNMYDQQHHQQQQQQEQQQQQQHQQPAAVQFQTNTAYNETQSQPFYNVGMHEPYDPTQPKTHDQVKHQTADHDQSSLQSQEVLVGSDYEVQQRWSQALYNLQQQATVSEDTANTTENNGEIKAVDESSTSSMKEESSVMSENDSELHCTQEASDEPINSLYDESGNPITTTPHLCVGHLPVGVKPSQVKVLLSKYGKVSSCKLASNRSGTRTTYFAMVTMETVEAAAKCIRVLNESNFLGSKILVKKIKNNPAARR